MSPPSLVSDLSELSTRQSSALNRRAMTWLVGMLVLAAASIGGLVLFLTSVEQEEQARQRTADAQWLDQTLRFHARRLEGDLSVLALQARTPGADPPPVLRAGELWRAAGAVRWQAWLAASQQRRVADWPAELRAAAREPGSEAALRTMLDTTRGLQRAAYAGPLASPGEHVPTLWLAVPLFEQGVFMGAQVAAIRLDRALSAVIPPWFLAGHQVTVVDPLRGAPVEPAGADEYLAPINLSGASLVLAIRSRVDDRALAPRLFFAVALVCLLGMMVALGLLWRDIARRQRVEAQLRTQMALRSAMERSMTLGLRAWGTDGRLLYVNQAFCSMVGYDAATLLQHTGPQPYWPAADPDEFQVLRQRMALPLEQQVGVELSLRHRDGHLLDVLVHGAPLVMADGSLIGWMTSALDVTERKRVERLAARQQEMLDASGRLIAVGEVASTLAHELNQPLGALSSFANGLLNRLRAGRITLDEVTPVIERMERIAEKAGRVIQRVNAFARRQEMNRQPLALNAFVTRVSSAVPLPERVTLALRLPDTDRQIPADALLLEHALHNVVLNAGEWAAPDPSAGVTGTVRVSLVVDDQQVGLRVEDSGPGVPPDLIPTLFDAFASRKAGGMGMGLSICRSIVEAHHGRIDVERSADLGGAQFTLWLPLEP